jgi:pimeloyl-ACP methyl ester carboxylesterase
VSNKDSLKGLLDTTNIERTKKKPALVYLHGGFSLGYEDVEDCKPFIDKGFVVFAPSYRGENGNPGNFEYFMGEVDDAKAAIRWLSEQPYVDKDSIYVFGHSIGGGMSLLLSLHNDIPIKASASCAGIYDKGSMRRREEEDKMVPYDISKSKENLYRLPIYTLDFMVREHKMYIGTDDNYRAYEKFVTQLYPMKVLKLQLIEVKGEHYSSLKPSMESFIKGIRQK